MKKFLLILFLLSSPCFAFENIKLKPDTDYLYFTDSKIRNVTTSDFKVISFRPVYTYSGDISQILFSSLKEGKCKIEINTDKETLSYEIEVVSEPDTENNEFMECDIPEIKTEN